jgi:hypothetical protein
VRLTYFNRYLYRLSNDCTAALRELAASSAGQCLNVNALVPLVTLSDSASIVPPINTWLQGLCYKGPSCNNDTLTNLGNTVQSECGQDLKDAGLPETIIGRLPELVVQYYAPVVDALCVRK